MIDQDTSLKTDTCQLSNGRTLAYTTSGARDGFPVIAHHGTPGSRLFAALLADVATEQQVTLIVPDRPGYGRSSPPPRDWAWQDWQTDVTELIRAESIRRAAVMGFSGGSPFALAAATSDWATQLGLVSAVIPPAKGGLARLSRIPFALRVLFRLFKAVTLVSGPESIVRQYTNRTVPAAVSRAIGAEFQEALRHGAKAVERENRLFATESLDSSQLSIPTCAWHGTEDENTPLSPVQAFLTSIDGTVVTAETDHLGTLLDTRRDVLARLRTE